MTIDKTGQDNTGLPLVLSSHHPVSTAGQQLVCGLQAASVEVRFMAVIMTADRTVNNSWRGRERGRSEEYLWG